jgi:transcriptional regulator with XRE-family HTH domain
MTYFATRLKNLRQNQNLSMQDLADKASVSKSMISKIERDEVQPTLDVAARLAKALGKTLADMLHAVQTTQVVHLPRKDQAVWEDVDHIKRRSISPVFEGLKMEWVEVTLPVGKSVLRCVSLNNQGLEKFILVVKGVLEVKLNEEVYQLLEGDSLYIGGNCPHDFHNPTNEPIVYYVIVKYGSKEANV